MDSSFAAAYIDNGNSYQFLGVKVRPFCLWHLFLLQTVDSPFVNSGTVKLFDLKTAIGICRLRYRQSRVKRPWYPILIPPDELEKEVKRFVEYIGDYASTIDYNIIPFSTGPEKPGPRITPPPNVVQVAFDAAHGARVPIAEAWDMPIGEAYIAQTMWFKIQGARVSFLDDDERKFQEEIKNAGSK